MQNRTSANIIGPDLNEYRGTVNYSLLATKTNYCYLRGSGNGSGRFREDKKFVEYVQGLKNVGIKSGAYHYAVPSYDLTTADAQCDAFINVLQEAYGPGSYGDLFPVIDIEAPTDKSISTDALLNWVDRFRKRFERKTRRVLMLYTGAFFIELYNNFYHSTKGFILSDMPLWIAMYPEISPNPPYPKDQGGWTRWRMWQYTESGTIAGVNPPVDLNYGPVNLDLLTQPRDVRNFKAVGNGRNIRMTWSANTDVDLAGYNVFMNSSYITTLGKHATSYTIELGPQVAPVERYEVAIEAFDTDGDFSPNRSKATVTFTKGRNIDEKEESNEEFIPMIMTTDGEVKEDIKDIVEEARSNMGIGNSLRYIDPVDNLERKFLGELMVPYREMNLDSSSDSEKVLYDDFVESNDEFDDKLYLKKLENEIAYKRYYSEVKDDSQLDFYDIHEDEDDDYDYIYTDSYGQRCKHKCSCTEDKNHDKKCKKEMSKEEDDETSDSKEDYNDDKEFIFIKPQDKKDDGKIKCDSCGNPYDSDDRNIDYTEKMKFKMKSHQSLNECDLSYKDENKKEDEGDSQNSIYKDRYEGDRRRIENKDSDKKINVCNDCTAGKDNCNSCEYLIYDMYLNNCDYGYKNHGDKKKNKHKYHKEDKHDKKKSKHKHR